ncbi:sigma-70 family RNA polymerase sigma factor [Stenotrophomonas sp.]|uniref:RNA polymerase sigma factor n=1 Tax=Stenotrophomonas sp. TaxID=69392 RepID=UPI0028A1F7A3|nr:sigma-70 family RNA polymerase sigma factor [Stenotrophomonas sp.]
MDERLDTPNQVDALLVVRCQLGERPAFDTLISRWTPSLHRYALKLAQDRDLADDLVQDVWVKVLRGLRRLREPERFRPWLFGIAHRTFIDRLRIRYALPEDVHVDLDALPHPNAGDDPFALHLAVHQGLDALPVIEREILTLFYLEDMPHADIAAALAIPIGTVKSRLHRARTLLRHHLTVLETAP